MPVGFQSIFEYWVSRQLFTWVFAALLRFQRGLGAIFYRILLREGIRSTSWQCMRKSQLTDFHICQLDAILYVKEPLKNAGS